MVEQTEPTLGVCAKCTLFFSFVMAVVVWLVVSDTAAPLPIGMPPPPPRVVVAVRALEVAVLDAWAERDECGRAVDVVRDGACTGNKY